eukprot:3690365-Heterocapsa_arctica.AAC.1
MAEMIGSLEDEGMLRRVTLWLSARTRYALTPGHALDMTPVDPGDGEPWDMNVLSKRAKTNRLIKQEKPKLLIGSPMCKAFSQLMALNWARMDPAKLEALIKEC